ncbi:MAG: deoxynucleoside kinase [Candidatus Scalindua sediminis]|nr:deoxynucleoside kinase [Candidatus Scalindua sediminis]
MSSSHSSYTSQPERTIRAGKLIVIEGIDGSGKTVQTRLLVERLSKQGYQVEMTDFPQYGKSFFADMIERYLKGEFGWPQELKDHLEKHPLPGKGFGSKPEEVNPYLSSLLYAGDRWEIKGQMNKWIDEGKIIISNRYVCSNMAHQGAKISNIKERNKFFKWIEELEYKVYAIPEPDLIIYLHVPTEVSQELIKVKVQSEQGFKSEVDMHEEDVNYLKRVQNIYTDIAKEDSLWSTIECSRKNQIIARDEIAEKVWKAVSKILN